MSLGLECQLKQIYQYIPAPSIEWLLEVRKVEKNPFPWRSEYDSYYNIFKDLSASFYFNDGIKNTFQKYKSKGFVFHKNSKKIDPKGIKEACLDLAQKINNIIPSVMAHNLKLVWERLRYLKPDIFPETESLEKMRSFLSSREFKQKDNKDNIEILDLSRSKIEIVPPEILNFSHLRTLYLADSKLGGYPYIVYAFKQCVNVIMEDTGSFYYSDSMIKST